MLLRSDHRHGHQPDCSGHHPASDALEPVNHSADNMLRLTEGTGGVRREREERERRGGEGGGECASSHVGRAEEGTGGGETSGRGATGVGGGREQGGDRLGREESASKENRRAHEFVEGMGKEECH